MSAIANRPPPASPMPNGYAGSATPAPRGRPSWSGLFSGGGRRDPEDLA
jgi:hypothetical protein